MGKPERVKREGMLGVSLVTEVTVGTTSSREDDAPRRIPGRRSGGVHQSSCGTLNKQFSVSYHLKGLRRITDFAHPPSGEGLLFRIYLLDGPLWRYEKGEEDARDANLG